MSLILRTPKCSRIWAPIAVVAQVGAKPSSMLASRCPFPDPEEVALDLVEAARSRGPTCRMYTMTPLPSSSIISMARCELVAASRSSWNGNISREDSECTRTRTGSSGVISP
jgi:Tfp pilus assembly protein PilE